MKQKIKAILSFLVVVVMAAGGLYYMDQVTARKDSQNKYADFYGQEADFDVLFLGQSRVLNGIFPMELWEEYGIVSYNMAGHGNRVPTNYWLLKNALEYTTPRLVVVDCGLMKAEDKVGSIEQLHLSVDHIPMSETKIAMIEDLLGDAEQKEDFLWTFSTYHHRWNDLTQEDFAPQINVEKGAESRIGVAVPDKQYDFGREEKIEGYTVGMEYLEKIITECQEAGIDVLLTYVPFPDSTGWQLESNRVWDIAQKYGVNYLDYHTLVAQINLETDCYDPTAHLNPSGARKITAYLGEYIQKNYEIPDQRDNQEYFHWQEDYEEYRRFKWKNLRTEEELKNYLMLLADKELSFGIWLEPGADWLNDSATVALLKNLGIDVTSYQWENCFVFVDQKKKQVYHIREGFEQNTGVGNISMRINFDTGAMILGQDEESFSLTTEAGAGILVYDCVTGELIDFAQFEVNPVSTKRTGK